jgi:hypothetical protein
MLRAKDGDNVSLHEESIWSHSQHCKIGNTLTHSWLSVSRHLVYLQFVDPLNLAQSSAYLFP